MNPWTKEVAERLTGVAEKLEKRARNSEKSFAILKRRGRTAGAWIASGNASRALRDATDLRSALAEIERLQARCGALDNLIGTLQERAGSCAELAGKYTIGSDDRARLHGKYAAYVHAAELAYALTDPSTEEPTDG